MKISHEIQINAPIESVWNLTLDIEAWPDHTTTMTKVEGLDPKPLAVGSRARIQQPAQPARIWTIKELRAPERFAWSTKLMGMTMTATHTLRSEGQLTVNALIVDMEGPLSMLFGWMLRGPILNAITSENEGLKAKLEGLP